jgi:hypothetical protein
MGRVAPGGKIVREGNRVTFGAMTSEQARALIDKNSKAAAAGNGGAR